jgi:hypothetical protein
MKKLLAVFTMVMALLIVNFTTNADAETNLALTGAASQSTVYPPQHVPSNCKDGITAGNAYTDPICHTAAQGQSNWWKVDLQQNSAITKIVVWNRTDSIDAFCYRLKDYTVSILDEAGNIVWSQQATDCPRPFTEYNMPAQTGKTVKIQAGPSCDYLNMAEVQVFGTTGIAIKLPSGPCPPNMPPRPDGGPVCGGSYTLADMGQFDDQDVWVWNQLFLDTITLAELDKKPMFGADWLNDITPTKVTSPPKITSGRLERRHFNATSDDQMRVVLRATGEGEVIRYAPLLLRECFKIIFDPLPPFTGHEVSTSCHLDPDVQRVEIFNVGDFNVPPPGAPLYTTVPSAASVPYTMADIESVKWTGRNLYFTPFMTEVQNYKSFSYDLTKNFWSFPDAWTPAIDLHFRSMGIPADLALGEVANLEIKIRGLADPILTKSIIGSIDNLPAIPGTISSTEYNVISKDKEKKSGKMVIRVEEVEVTYNNITVREVPDIDGIGPALVIQWPEPDVALFGGLGMPLNSSYQVRVYVGNIPPADVAGSTEVFYYYNIPAQMGTCVVEGPAYEELLVKMQEKGFSKADLRVGVHYREVYNTPSGIQYYNRGFSPYVTINEN